MRPGDRVSWTYNSRQKNITKEGTLLKFINGKGKTGRTIVAKYGQVQFDGNKNPSKILLKEIMYVPSSDIIHTIE